MSTADACSYYDRRIKTLQENLQTVQQVGHGVWDPWAHGMTWRLLPRSPSDTARM